MKSDTCNCCKPPTGGTPVAIDNRPGLSAVAYRVGTFATFRQAMFQAIPRSAELRDLRTRHSDDYAITILELWAAIGDILTFYQERAANEAFLRTATLRDSVLRMARMIGYELSPGSAATALLSFTAEQGKQVDVPVGLRVQSVPEQDEKPQKYETLETLTVYDWLNGQRIFPAPFGINPLAKGTTATYITAGDDGFRAAENLVEDDRILLSNLSASEPVEEITVQSLTSDHEHLFVRFKEPIQKVAWDVGTRAFKAGGSFRLFGYNTPPRYSDVELFSTGPSAGTVKQWKFFNIDQTPGGTNGYALPAGSQLNLDSRYDDLKVGARLLLVDGSSQQALLTVTSVDQVEDSLGIMSDTVTRITVTPGFSQIPDRRHVVIHELSGPPITFWGFSYGDIIDSATVYVPGGRVDTETIEIARPVEKNAYQDGYAVKLTDIETGRQAILKDENEAPFAASINRVTITGSEMVFDATADDAESLYLLSLDPGTAKTVTALCSASLEVFPALSGSTPSLDVTIGSIGSRTITLSGPLTTKNGAAASLESAIQAADTDPVFSEARVRVLDNRLIVLPGDLESKIRFSKTTDDETTIVEFGLDEDHVKTLTGLLSGELDPVPSYTKVPPQLSVSIGPLDSKIIELDPTAATRTAIAADLQSKLTAADIAPFFKYARVLVIDKNLLLFPGIIGTSHQDYLRIELGMDSALELHRTSAVLMGNVAQTSHGETVANEVLGDADPATTFQEFTLKKSPVTFVPSPGEGGTDNTLRLFVNDVLWKEVDSLYGRGASETVYRTHINNDGEMSVRFGDGVTGARPPKGRSNVTAAYRKGTGLEGRVKAGALKTLLDKPKGLKSVINPDGTDGGADPETLDNARKNAPTTVRTFDRAVSLLDFEDLARGLSEVAKARVTWVWNGEFRAAHLTIAGQKGGTFSSGSLSRIHASLTARRDPNRQLFVDNYTTIPILVTATLNINAAYVAARATESALSVLLSALSFESLDFAQSIHLSDIYAILQSVPGVDSVDIDLLMFKQKADATDTEFDDFLDGRGITRLPDGAPKAVQSHLRIFPARLNAVSKDPAVFGAEQASIESSSQDVTILTKGGLPE